MYISALLARVGIFLVRSRVLIGQSWPPFVHTPGLVVPPGIFGAGGGASGSTVSMEPAHGHGYGSLLDGTGPCTPESQQLLPKGAASAERMNETATRHGANVGTGSHENERAHNGGTRRRQRPLSATETRQNARKRVLLYATAAAAALACVATSQHIMAVREERRAWLLDERSGGGSATPETETQRLDAATLRLHRQLGECWAPPPFVS